MPRFAVFLVALGVAISALASEARAVKYDDASWHSGGEYPKGLPEEAAATHIGMFAAWAMLNGIGGAFHAKENPEDVEALKARRITPGAWLLRDCDGKLTDEDFSEEGNRFAAQYYGEGGMAQTYYNDYLATFPEHPELYDVPDTWESYARIEPKIRARYEAWKAKR